LALIILTATDLAIVTDGDLLVLHLNSKADELYRGWAIHDIIYVQIRKIIEHWDVAQIVPKRPLAAT
jgi:predicted SnoaL-like aldol condensation-catalyzing enzyme